MRQSAQFQLNGPLDAGLGCLKISTRPGRTQTGVNHIDVYGADGDQMLNMLEPVPFPFDEDVPLAVELGDGLYC